MEGLQLLTCCSEGFSLQDFLMHALNDESLERICEII